MGIDVSPGWKNLSGWLGRLRQRPSVHALGL
jgi:hypothetical protein